ILRPVLAVILLVILYRWIFG
ncbi:hypothetical protein K3Z99_34700, partial [Pseudomonas aeruginosa]|nr:hypothetical protein [Pseudomonas aeruginosa]